MKVSVHPVKIVIPPSHGRSVGVHVSSIIRCIAAETGILKPEWITEELSIIEVGPSTQFDDPVRALRVSLGLAWEDWYIRTQLVPLGIVDHPDEMHCEGIYMSPDAEELSVIITEKGPRHKIKIHEIKSTYKSTKTVGETEVELKSQFIWMSQLKSYCKAAKTTLADLHVLFFCGDYSWPQQPDKKRFEIEFTQDEIEDNWQLLKDYRDHKLRMETE